MTLTRIVGGMIYLLQLPDGQIFRCRDAAQAKRCAELLIVLATGAPPVTN